MELNELRPSLRKRQKRRDKRLDEEVIECYRTGWRIKRMKGYLKHARAVPPDGGMREGMKKRYGGRTRQRNDNLEPLERYLRSQVGKHWDGVYSDLCRSLDRNSTIGQHVFDHLKHMVHTNVVKHGKQLITHDGNAPRDIARSSWFWGAEFYVHPKSGVLMRIQPQRIRRGRK